MKRNSGAVAPEAKLAFWELSVPQGLADVARRELGILRIGGAALLETSQPAILRLKGDPALRNRLLSSKTTLSLFAVYRFEIPRPRAFLGEEHLTRLVGCIEGNLLSQKSFRFGAAGSDSAVFNRLAETLVNRLKLRHDPKTGELLMRFRPSEDGEAWEVLIRASELPLSVRSWRLVDFPGALNGPVAAAIVLLSEPTAGDRVCNLMSGSGTLLIERALAGPARSLVGVELDFKLIEAARTNYRGLSEGQEIRWIQGDARATPLSGNRFDVVYCDLPWGERVGKRARLSELYKRTCFEIERLLVADGVAFMLTQRGEVLGKVLSEFKSLEVLDTRRIYQGGFNPTLYHIKRVRVE